MKNGILPPLSSIKPKKRFYFAALCSFFLLLSSCGEKDSGSKIPSSGNDVASSQTNPSQEKEDSSSDDDHIHTFSNDWEHDDQYHWHPSTCGHDVIDGKAPHSFGEYKIIVQPTLSEDGLMRRSCSICSYVQEEAIEKVDMAKKVNELFEKVKTNSTVKYKEGEVEKNAKIADGKILFYRPESQAYDYGIGEQGMLYFDEGSNEWLYQESDLEEASSSILEYLEPIKKAYLDTTWTYFDPQNLLASGIYQDEAVQASFSPKDASFISSSLEIHLEELGSTELSFLAQDFSKSSITLPDGAKIINRDYFLRLMKKIVATYYPGMTGSYSMIVNFSCAEEECKLTYLYRSQGTWLSALILKKDFIAALLASSYSVEEAFAAVLNHEWGSRLSNLFYNTTTDVYSKKQNKYSVSGDPNSYYYPSLHSAWESERALPYGRFFLSRLLKEGTKELSKEEFASYEGAEVFFTDVYFYCDSTYNIFNDKKTRGLGDAQIGCQKQDGSRTILAFSFFYEEKVPYQSFVDAIDDSYIYKLAYLKSFDVGIPQQGGSPLGEEFAERVYREEGGFLYEGSAMAPHYRLLSCKDKKIVSATLPEDTREIAPEAFANCYSLVSVEGLEHIEVFGDLCFANCVRLDQDLILRNVKTIGASSFAYCGSAYEGRHHDVLLGANLEKIARGSVFYSSLYSSFFFAMTPGDWMEVDLENYAFHGASNFLDPNGSLSFAGERFSPLKSLLIPADVEEIDSAHFNDLPELEEVRMSEGSALKKIAGFTKCPKLSSVSLKEGLVECRAFVESSQLTSLSCPDSLRVLEIPHGVIDLSIGEGTIDVNLSYFDDGDEARKNFFQKDGDALYIKSRSSDYHCLYHDRSSSGSSRTVHKGCKVIHNSAFWDDASQAVTSLTLPSELALIKSSSFYNLIALTNLSYLGTKAQWEKIEKAPDWLSGYTTYGGGKPSVEQEKVVHCSDGELAL